MDDREHHPLKILHTLFLVFVISNLVLLDIVIVQNKSSEKAARTKIEFVNNTEEVKEEVREDACGSDCIARIYDAIYEATVSSKISHAPIEEKKTESRSNIQTESLVKEFSISFGSGANSTDDWTDVPGLAAYVDSTKYGAIKEVVFEASIRIPTGNQRAYARLFNVTDKHPVWFSEVSLEGGKPQLLISQPITLDSGNKLYQVQMKTSLKYQAILDQARLHITVY